MERTVPALERGMDGCDEYLLFNFSDGSRPNHAGTSFHKKSSAMGSGCSRRCSYRVGLDIQTSMK